MSKGQFTFYLLRLTFAPMPTAPFDLRARARQAALDAGFHPDIPAEVMQETQRLKQQSQSSPPAGVRDLRSLAWSSIDNDTSRDLDQVEYVERLADGTLRLLVGIADVDSLVAKGTSIDRRAQAECTSVYTGVAIFPMLPNDLSTGMTSLLDEQERLALVIEVRISDSGEVTGHDVFPGLLRNQAKLAYNSTGAWLEGRGPMPQPLAAVPGMEQQLRLQHETSQALRGLRKRHGTLTFGSIEATPVVENGEVKDLTIRGHNAAEDIIESFMVAANVAIARYLKEKNTPSIRRVVKTPRRWDRIQTLAAGFGVHLPSTPDPKPLSQFLEQRQAADPDHFPDLSLAIVKLLGPGEYIVEAPGAEHTGHFGLATNDYTHSTAPNRRFADLATQRLVKAAVAGVAEPYALGELSTIAAHCTEREDAARKVERLMRKVIAANLLRPRIGEIFDGVITGASPKGTYVRLKKFPAEGRIVRREHGCDVGDKVRIKLCSVDVGKGFIDFERLTD